MPHAQAVLILSTYVVRDKKWRILVKQQTISNQSSEHRTLLCWSSTVPLVLGWVTKVHLPSLTECNVESHKGRKIRHLEEYKFSFIHNYSYTLKKQFFKWLTIKIESIRNLLEFFKWYNLKAYHFQTLISFVPAMITIVTSEPSKKILFQNNDWDSH